MTTTSTNIPAPIKPGDCIGIVSVASKVSPNDIEPGLCLLENEGYQVIKAPHLYDTFHQFAGTDKQRAADFQSMIDNPDIKAIVCSRGGYGSIRILQHINWTNFSKQPKWLVGFSDITVLHAAINQMGIASVHAAMPRYFVENNSPTDCFSTLMQTLTHQALAYQHASNPLNRSGNAFAPIIGGNLSILYSLRGTPWDLDTNGRILFIEDISEHLYHLDRMMQNLKTGGKLKNLAGLIVGGFTAMKDNDTPFGKTAEEIIYEAVSEYHYPLVFGFPAGHQPNNMAIPLGIKANLEVNNMQSSLTFQFAKNQ